MRLLRMVAGDRGACASGRPWPMAGRRRPYSISSAGVKSNRPVGIAVMTLLFKTLQYTPRRIAKPRHGGGGVATGGSISRIRGSTTMPG